MRTILAGVLLAAISAWSHAQPIKIVSPENAIARQAACGTCGVVQSVRVVRKELSPTSASGSSPTGFVYSVPLGGGKGQLGSSTQLGKDVVPVAESWELVVRMDDGRYRLMRSTEEPDVRDGDKVRVNEKGQVTLRTD